MTKVLRKQLMETKNIQVGDQIIIALDGYDKLFTATAQRITEEGTLFLFDDCIGRITRTSEFDNFFSELLKAFPTELKNRVRDIKHPTYGQIFGHDDWYRKFLEPDEDDRFPLMKIRKNRIADFENDWEWYWLQNKVKSEYSAPSFAFVSAGGLAYPNSASLAYGVRPVFLLLNE